LLISGTDAQFSKRMVFGPVKGFQANIQRCHERFNSCEQPLPSRCGNQLFVQPGKHKVKNLKPRKPDVFSYKQN
jgi:hypothetical protein